MGILESFRIGFNMIRLHKLRAFLTMLGVIIGVMSVSMIVLISGAFRSYLTAEVSRLGSDLVYIAYAPNLRGEDESIGTVGELTVDDADYIMARVPEVDIVSAAREAGRRTLRVPGKEVKEVTFSGVDQHRSKMTPSLVIRGRDFTERDFSERNNVGLITEEVEKELFGDKSALGQRISVDGLSIEVIGINKPEEFLGQRDNKAMLLPLQTMNSKFLGDNRADVLMAKMKPGVEINAGMDKIWEALMIKSGNRRIYRVDSSQNLLNFLGGALGAASGVLAGIAALSLLVGGIGIMNIMLVSVTERTREIGLRMSVGAKKFNILLQFLIESATLSLVGGLIGMGLAYVFGLAISVFTRQMKWPNEGGLAAPFPFEAALGAALFSAIIGMIFGFYPAFRASRLQPITALRAE